ncbi:MAG: autotransporter-associated beta strand repeat-containing protein, partial [Desulfobaccales bacterium]
MARKTYSLGLAGKAERTLFLAIFIFLLLISLAFSPASATTIDWQAEGPSPINQGQATIVPDNPVVGALQSLLVDPTDSNTLYVGAVNGGIWKTTNGGGVWTPLTDGQNSLSMGGMALDPGNSSRILAGFGVFSNFRGSGGPPDGVIFSSDAGATWTSVGGVITANTNVSAVLLKDQLMFVASRDNILNAGPPTPVTGLFRSTDGGASFIEISGSGGLPTGSVTSLAFDPGDYKRIYAAVQKQGLFRSDDQGKTWTNITPASSGIGTTTQNVQLTVGAGGQSLFMGVANNLGKGNVQLQTVWRSLDQGATWQNMGGQGSGAGQGLPGTIEDGKFVGIQPGGQGDINFALLADTKNPNYVYISGDRQAAWNELTNSGRQFPNQIRANDFYGQLFRGDASKALSSPPEVDPWNTTTPYDGQWLPLTSNFAADSTAPHADSRSMAFDANGNLLETDDGGVYRRSDPQSSTGRWTSLNGNLQVTEIYGLSYDSNTHTVISGNQDTGAAEQNKVGGSPSLTWREIVLGDGAKTAVNDGDPTFSVHYMSYTNLADFARLKVDTDNKILDEVLNTDLRVVTGPDTTESLTKYEKEVGSSIPPYAPIRVNQADKTNLAIGTQRLYLATDDASSGLTQDLKLTDICSDTFASSVADIAYGRPGNANLLLAAEGNRLWLSTTLQVGSLTQLSGYNGANNITSVCINANSDRKFYAADGTAVRDTGDQGTTWTKRLSLSQLNALQFISNGLNAVVAGGYGALYAARDTDLDNWYSLKGTLPNTFIWEMDYSIRDDTLAVGTLGRGAFTLANASTLMPATPSSVDRDWIRLLRAGSDNQTLNGGTVQTPDPITYAKDLTLTALGGTFDTAGSDVTVNGVIKGAGSFTKAGDGILSLRGTNTYAGGTLFNAGTVNILSDANLGAASGGLTFNGGTLQAAADFTSARAITLLPYGGTLDTNTFNSTLSGVISGAGTLSKISNGTLNLSSTNTYSGGTLLNGGTLNVVSDANLGAATGPLTFNGGTLQVGAALTTSRTMVVLDNGGAFDTGTFASSFNGPLFGYGIFNQQGAGSLTLGGDGSPFAGTYTLNAGTFTLNNNLGSTLSPCSMV